VEIGESVHWNYIKDQITEQQWEWLWHDAPDGGIGCGLFRHGHCYKGSFEAMKELDRIGDIVIITHRPKSAIKDTMEWISFNGIPASAVHLMYREEPKSFVKPECGIYVDDKVANCIDLSENTDGLACLWDRAWNRAEQKDLTKEVQIIDSWEKFLTLAKEKA